MKDTVLLADLARSRRHAKLLDVLLDEREWDDSECEEVMETLRNTKAGASQEQAAMVRILCSPVRFTCSNNYLLSYISC